MRVGWLGLGELGFPLAVGCALKGIDITGYDIRPELMTLNPRSYREAGPDGTGDLNTLIPISGLKFSSSLESLVSTSEVIILCLPTPHSPEYEGITYMPKERKDFDYTYLVDAVKTLSLLINKPTVISIISTVLPGTLRREIIPILTNNMKLVYSPQLPAQGTSVRDFLFPEYYILGVDDKEASDVMRKFYSHINPSAPIRSMSVESAECLKMCYNTFITMKISYAQTIMELAHKLEGVDVDDVTSALQAATQRLISPKYMTAGMQDSGKCHPRDGQALSYLSEQLDLSYDLFGELVKCREHQMEWIAELCADEYDMMEGDFDNIEPMLEHILILGYTFKKESNITTGSSALLVKHILEEWGYAVTVFDPYVDGSAHGSLIDRPGVILIGMNHDDFAEYYFPERSVVIDPFRYIPDQEGIKVIRVGESK